MPLELRPLSREEIVNSIVKERERQEALFDETNSGVSPVDFLWTGIIVEQTGKALSALNYCRRQALPLPDPDILNAYEQELIKTAASALQAIEKIQGLKRQITNQLAIQG